MKTVTLLTERLVKMSSGLSLYKDGMTATQVAATERPSFARNKGAYSGDALAIYTAGSETVLLKHGGGNYKFPNTFFQYQGDWLRGRMHGTCCCTMSSGSKKIMIMRTPSPSLCRSWDINAGRRQQLRGQFC